MTKEAIQTYITFIEHNPCGTWKGGEEHNGVITMPYVEYAPMIHELIHAFGCSNLNDFHYLEHARELFDRFDELLPTMTANQIGICLTFIFRGEHFCDGHILGYIKNGKLVALLKRLLIVL